MTRNATGSCSCPVRALIAASFVAGAFCATPALAQRAVTDETVTVEDVARMPLDDLNIDSMPIPRALQSAAQAPYDQTGIDDCGAVLNEIADLDAVLGEDLDMMAPPEEDGINIGETAKNLLGSLIPYRGLIRAVSGASRQAELLREAIAAGMMRRAYMKGLGQAMGCPYPARPAPPELIASTILVREEAAEPEEHEVTGGREVAVEPDED